MAEEHSQIGPVFHAQSNPHIPWPDEAAIRRERNYQLLQASAAIASELLATPIDQLPGDIKVSEVVTIAVMHAVALLTEIERQA